MEEETLEEKVRRLEAEVADLRDRVAKCVIKEELAPAEEEAGEIATPLPAEAELPSPEEAPAEEEAAETEE